jgi:RHS repeat-associated protein
VPTQACHSRRVKSVAGSATRYSVYGPSPGATGSSRGEDAGALIEIDEVGGAKTDYIRASGMTLARVAGSTVTWLHHDHLGSAVAGTNAAGAVVWRESEQPFGEDWTSAAANDNQADYTGHVEDAATGLTYMQARYYDPVIGRFLSIDPVGFSPGRPDMFNRYAYAANDPVNMMDPDGGQALAIGRVALSAVRSRGVHGALKAFREAKVDWNTMNAGTTATVSQQAAAAVDVLLGTDILSEAEGQTILIQNANEFDKKSKGLQKNADKHKEKLEAFKKDPDKYDNKGHLKNAGSDTAKREKIIESRIRKLERDIKQYEKQAEKAAETAKEIRKIAGESAN